MTPTEVNTSEKIQTIAYDVAEQLRTPEEMTAYLEVWFDEFPDDAAGVARAVDDIARAKVCPKRQQMFT